MLVFINMIIKYGNERSLGMAFFGVGGRRKAIEEFQKKCLGGTRGKGFQRTRESRDF